MGTEKVTKGKRMKPEGGVGRAAKEPEPPAEQTPPAPTTEGRDEADTPTKLHTNGIPLPQSLDEPGVGFTGSEARARNETTELASELPITANEWSFE